jgi:hypothetical protein
VFVCVVLLYNIVCSFMRVYVSDIVWMHGFARVSEYLSDVTKISQSSLYSRTCHHACRVYVYFCKRGFAAVHTVYVQDKETTLLTPTRKKELLRCLFRDT